MPFMGPSSSPVVTRTSTRLTISSSRTSSRPVHVVELAGASAAGRRAGTPAAWSTHHCCSSTTSWSSAAWNRGPLSRSANAADTSQARRASDRAPAGGAQGVERRRPRSSGPPPRRAKPPARRSSSRRTAAAAAPVAETPPETQPRVIPPYHQDDNKDGRREYRSPDGTWRVVRPCRRGGNRKRTAHWEVHEPQRGTTPTWHCRAAFERGETRWSSWTRRPVTVASRVTSQEERRYEGIY